MKKDSKEMLREIGDYCVSLGTGMASTMLVSGLLGGIVDRSAFNNNVVKCICKVGATSIGVVTGLKVMKETEEQLENCHEATDILIELIHEKREKRKQKKLSKKEEA